MCVARNKRSGTADFDARGTKCSSLVLYRAIKAFIYATERQQTPRLLAPQQLSREIVSRQRVIRRWLLLLLSLIKQTPMAIELQTIDNVVAN